METLTLEMRAWKHQARQPQPKYKYTNIYIYLPPTNLPTYQPTNLQTYKPIIPSSSHSSYCGRNLPTSDEVPYRNETLRNRAALLCFISFAPYCLKIFIRPTNQGATQKRSTQQGPGERGYAENK